MAQEKTSSEHLASHTCRIRTRLPGLNEFINANRTNRYMGAQMKRNAQDSIAWFIKPLPRFERPVTIDFHWVDRTMRRDLDNISFAKKFILDALVEQHKLKDDSPKFVRGFTDTFEKGDEDGVIVTITEVEE